MGPVTAIRTCITKSFKFSGRATRPEFWWFALTFVVIPHAIAFVVAFPIGFAEGHAKATGSASGQSTNYGFAYQSFLVAKLILCPAWLAAATRRLRDAGRSVAWLAIPIPTFFLVMAGVFTVAHVYDADLAVLGQYAGFYWPHSIAVIFLPLLFMLSLPSRSNADTP